MTDPGEAALEESGLGLPTRFVRQIEDDGILVAGDRLVVALSGGMDSTVLLHLLRFTEGLPSFQLVAAHFDHRMRPDSARDRRWVSGLCRAWDVPLEAGEADSPPSSEDEARRARYDFLSAAEDKVDGAWVLTAHHGDDQAETILFRIFRGTGLRGLAGIPRDREPGLYRPLLPFSRKELLTYAGHHGIRFREDPTNLDLSLPRNFLRHHVLPELESGPAPAARESLRRLARLARENEEAWESLLPDLLDQVFLAEGGKREIVRSRLLSLHPGVQTRLLREVLRKSGIQLDEAGTRAAMEFTRTGASGQDLSLPGGMVLRRAFDRFQLQGPSEPGTHEALVLAGPGDGSGEVTVGGKRFEVGWRFEVGRGLDANGVWDETLSVSPDCTDFPLTLRGWEPGDRIQLPYGTKKLKKLFSEAKIPVGERARIPVLADGEGRVLWVPGLASSITSLPNHEPGSFFIGIRHADTN